MDQLAAYFTPFRENIIGYNQTFQTPYGQKRIVYADWIASGRLYQPIEMKIAEIFGPFVGNTHSESSVTGTSMTRAYHQAHEIIKRHVNAGPKDILLHAGFGMTAAVNKFQRLLGLKIPDLCARYANLLAGLRPVVFVTHMEHHSNQTTWLETNSDVVVIPPNEAGLIDLDALDKNLEKYKLRRLKIGAFTACSNVTGIQTPIHQMAKIMHQHNGHCFVDFAASAPYVKIDMHPQDPAEKLDAIFLSPHKFLGGPGSSGILIFDSELYHNEVPDHPGGGTVAWTDPWGHHRYFTNIEAREDGGTPGFLQSIRAALAIKLKEQMSIEKMMEREEELVKILFRELKKIPGIHILADNEKDRLGVFSFYCDRIHYNFIVKCLNDRFGIQVRGGCSCAGTYGHYLLHVGQQESHRIASKIEHGDLSEKPGWVRMSIHPTMTEEELYFIIEAIRETAQNAVEWAKDYTYSHLTNEFQHKRQHSDDDDIKKWFYFNNQD